MVKVIVDEQALLALCAERFVACGVADEDAASTARVLVLAEMMGIATHGVGRVATYCTRLQGGGVKAAAEPVVKRVAPALLHVDGDNGLGPAVAMRALAAVMETARETGIAAAFLHHSNHFGAAAPYCLIAAESGLATVLMSNSTPLMAPTGGAEPSVGNNPIGFGFPGPDELPLVIDFSMSAVARSRIRDAARRGEAIPEGWAIDAGGQPLTDAATAMKGMLLPMGGHKGYGLAIAIDMLAGVLSGAAFLSQVPDLEREPAARQNLGQAFIAINAAKLMTPGELADRTTKFMDMIGRTRSADPAHPVRFPGSRAMANLKQARRDGVRVDRDTLEVLRRR
ncbi:Ldh family oxidoreductase [Pseudorhizobium pelagicum]|uniref:Ldh family oxidoreductase n=1 Tax=Pseudorhizobium pelagicum TaxID=1509405 RepID=A0A922NWX9_9HYPH|nr:Ldh family oxidoreductase [Pseudorhizobium pelagicum]KEQ02785.1 hypothetical protein GV67_17055 [Pseudorhizobium pelagicum]KEQ02805.1 hypothetical protein GV68_19900 [Pseudorhizobium pelagicum]